MHDGEDSRLRQPGDLRHLRLGGPSFHGLDDESVPTGSPVTALAGSAGQPSGKLWVDHGGQPANALIACGVAVSKPTTSSMPGSRGSAMVKPVAVMPTTMSLASMPEARR